MNYDPDSSTEQLLQLERELFSLTPVETPRHLMARLDQQVVGNRGVGCQVVSSPAGTLRWGVLAVPAAAAVAVVSVLSQLETPPGHSTNEGFGQARGGVVRASNSGPSNYVVRAEPVVVTPGAWQAIEHKFFIQPASVPVFPGPTSYPAVVFH